MSTLKPCPFCGGKVKIKKISDDEGFCWFAIVKEPGDGNCKCHISMESAVFPDNEPEECIEEIRQELIEDWNTRYERTCHLVDDPRLNSGWFRCSECNATINQFSIYCDSCGARVVPS